MGLHGSSTTPLILQDARVPAENVLGEIGKGHKVAFNVLNYGRFKLGAMCSGGARRRHRRGGAVCRAAQAVRPADRAPSARSGTSSPRWWCAQYAVESDALPHRRAHRRGIARRAATRSDAVLAALEEFAIEASILKVAGSEMIDFVVDENVQIHGGNGFVRDYPAERHYRDARVNRIFEGTNEINRLLIPGMLARRAREGRACRSSRRRRRCRTSCCRRRCRAARRRPARRARRAVAAMKKVALMVLGTAMQTYGDRLADEQEVLIAAADIIIDVYAAESALLRAAAAGRSPLARRRRRRASSSTTPPAASRSRRATRCRDGRRGHAADAARGAAPVLKVTPGEHRGARRQHRGCRRRAQGVSFLECSVRRRSCRSASGPAAACGRVRKPVTIRTRSPPGGPTRTRFMRSSRLAGPAGAARIVPAAAVLRDRRASTACRRRLKVARGDDVMEMSTSTGKPRRMRRIGTLAFTLKGQPQTLTAFAEATTRAAAAVRARSAISRTASETYQGGRYLDLDRTGSGVYELDFNRAYHPFCVFNPGTSARFRRARTGCRVPIRAGERLR